MQLLQLRNLSYRVQFIQGSCKGIGAHDEKVSHHCTACTTTRRWRNKCIPFWKWEGREESLFSRKGDCSHATDDRPFLMRGKLTSRRRRREKFNLAVDACVSLTGLSCAILSVHACNRVPPLTETPVIVTIKLICLGWQSGYCDTSPSSQACHSKRGSL